MEIQAQKLSKHARLPSKANEYDEYKQKLEKYPVNFIISNNDCINAQRNFIVQHYPAGQRLMGLDDDIQSLETKINSKKTQTVTDLIGLEQQAYELCNQYYCKYKYVPSHQMQKYY